jgi:hypothetical protein
MSDADFTVDGTLIQTGASQKSFRSQDGSDDDDGSNFRGQKRSNQTHASTTDCAARLYKKSYPKGSRPSCLGHALVENRNGLRSCYSRAYPRTLRTQRAGMPYAIE